jgi:hypothetical protein
VEPHVLSARARSRIHSITMAAAAAARRWQDTDA